MTLVQLEYIISLETHRHFAVAAEKCFVTQPTLSMQVQKLEDSLGVVIFDRKKHPIEPTPIGAKLIQQARVILNESKKVNELILDEKQEIQGDINIGIIPTLAPYLVPLFISSLVEKHPKLNLTIREQVTDNLINSIDKDQIDIGLLVTPLNDENLLEKPLFYEAFQVYASHNHKLYKESSIEPKSLATDGLWLLNEGHCFRDQALNICNLKDPSKFTGRINYESGSLEALKRMVDRHGGFTLLPELNALGLSKDEKLRLRSFKDPIPTREVSLVVKKSYPKNQLIQAVFNEIIENLPPIMTSRKNSKIVKWK